MGPTRWALPVVVGTVILFGSVSCKDSGNSDGPGGSGGATNSAPGRGPDNVNPTPVQPTATRPPDDSGDSGTDDPGGSSP